MFAIFFWSKKGTKKEGAIYLTEENLLKQYIFTLLCILLRLERELMIEKLIK